MAIEPRFHEVIKDGPIVTWKFSNPPRNLISPETGEELQQLVTEFDADAELRVGILTSATPGKFIQHFDVSAIIGWAEETSKLTAEELEALRASVPPPRGLYDYSSKPIICSINGPVEGGGCELAMYCDFRFISRDAFMGQPEVRGGFPPGYGVPRMIQLIGLGRTLELCMSARRVFPEEAERIGLVNKVCDPQDLESEVRKFAQLLASMPPQGVAAVKETVYKAADITIEEGLRLNMNRFFESIRDPQSLLMMKLYVAAGQDGEKLAEIFAEVGEDPQKALEKLQKESKE